jgi:hypothetical protein
MRVLAGNVDQPVTGQILETNLITNLAPPNQLHDLGWLKPGKTTFPWWNGNATTDTLNRREIPCNPVVLY